MEGGGIRVSIVVAVDLHRMIGASHKNGGLPWPRHKKDMKRFVEITKPKPIIIGRTTYELIPQKYRPFSDRPTVVVSRTFDYAGEGAYTADSPAVALSLAVAFAEERDGDEIIIAGGEKIYAAFLAMNVVDRIYLTQILGEFEGDTIFPVAPEPPKWKISQGPTIIKPDAENPYPMIFTTFDHI